MLMLFPKHLDLFFDGGPYGYFMSILAKQYGKGNPPSTSAHNANSCHTPSFLVLLEPSLLFTSD